jgi:hypothetical protein
MDFSSLGTKFKLKFEISWNFELQSFELTRFYCTCLWTQLGKILHLFSFLLITYVETKQKCT